jgi:hypothetical protein
MKHIGFSATEVMEETLKAIAKDMGISKSALIKTILSDWLKERA